MSETLLPSAFAELEQFAPLWCLPTETERWDRRVTSSMAEMEQFYNAFFPRLEEAIEYCDKFSLDELPAGRDQPAVPDLFADHGGDGGRNHAPAQTGRRVRCRHGPRQ